MFIALSKDVRLSPITHSFTVSTGVRIPVGTPKISMSYLALSRPRAQTG